MIKFFRKIRLQLLTENKMGKYFKYAIGEILLVVIGILIAIQINSFYNKQSADKVNTKLLNRMVEEVKLNIDRLDFIEFMKGAPEVAKPFSAFESKKRLDSVISLLNLGLNDERIAYMNDNKHFNSSAYNLYTSVYEEMKNTGKLYNIGSDSLITKINVYYKLLEREDYYHKASINVVFNLKDECKYGWEKFRSDYYLNKSEALKKHTWLLDSSSKHYTDVLFYFLEARKTSRRSIERMQGMRAASNDLIKSIEKELDSNK